MRRWSGLQGLALSVSAASSASSLLMQMLETVN